MGNIALSLSLMLRAFGDLSIRFPSAKFCWKFNCKDHRRRCCLRFVEDFLSLDLRRIPVLET